ncbi:MAG: undecaprenyl-diphosphate phosphatase [Candidatus Falkowbacteria bacterium]|nr:undecaprenyl-diphosphate phosphatase [Candidatus Falkowbacteria bacterium]
MSFIHAIILGIIEGITEFLPISSTGHLMFASKIFNIPLTPFVTSFNIYIQLGAILAIVVLYIKKLLTKWNNVLFVASAFVPTIIIGLLVYPFVKKVLLTNLLVVALALIIGGLGLIMFEKYYKTKESNKDLTIKNSFWIGVYQMLAVIPGVSRSAATIIGGMLMGVSREKIVEFSFFLAIPTMAAASGLDVLENGWQFSANEWQVLGLGFAVSFITALLAVKWFISYVQKHTFTAFGIYRIIIGLIILLFFLK